MDIDLLVNDKMKKNLKKKLDNGANNNSLNIIDEREELINMISDKLKNYPSNILSKDKDKELDNQEKELDELIDNLINICIKFLILRKKLI
jgi:hypothetical protein